MQALPPLTFAGWTRALNARGYGVLPASHAVPVSLWLRDDAPGDDAPGDDATEGRVLHYSARGTRLRLAVYRPSDLTTLILRAACDCAEHRQAGATGRVALNPGTEPVEVHELDGAKVFGWRGHEAALLPLHESAGILESLLPRLTPLATPRRPVTEMHSNRAEAS
jgi:hypothetical protein